MATNTTKTYAKKPKCWTDSDMENALKEVLSGQSSIRGAASHHGLNESSVRHRLKRLSGGKKQGTQGRTPAFSSEVEATLASNVQTILNRGANLKADDVLDIIEQYLNKHNIYSTFKEGRPGKDWLRSFLARNKLSLKKTAKDGQVVMTVCRCCQELGPPPLNIPPGKKWTRAWALVDDPAFEPTNINFTINVGKNKFIVDEDADIKNSFAVDEDLDVKKENFHVDADANVQKNNFTVDADANVGKNNFPVDTEVNVETNNLPIDGRSVVITDKHDEKTDLIPTVYIINHSDDSAVIDIRALSDESLDTANPKNSDHIEISAETAYPPSIKVEPTGYKL